MEESDLRSKDKANLQLVNEHANISRSIRYAARLTVVVSHRQAMCNLVSRDFTVLGGVGDDDLQTIDE